MCHIKTQMIQSAACWLIWVHKSFTQHGAEAEKDSNALAGVWHIDVAMHGRGQAAQRDATSQEPMLPDGVGHSH